MIKVMIVAPYAAIRAGLRALLREAADIHIVGEVCGSEEMEELLPNLNPDVIVFDANEEEGRLLLDRLNTTDAGLVVLSELGETWARLMASEERGWSVLRKTADGEEIVYAVQAVSVGLIALDRTFVSQFDLVDPPHEVAFFGELGTALPRVPAGDGEPLSPREREVLQLMALGLPNKQIAGRLSITLSTVKFHVAGILSKMGASSRTEAVTLGIRRGEVSI